MASTHTAGILGRAWRSFPLKTGYGYLDVLLLAAPAAVALELGHGAPVLIFAASALAIVPLAGVLGEATEAISTRSGPTVGGLFNATMGNATELIIAFFALRAGHVEVVKASLSGSIIGNLLLVLGASILVGGIGRERQTFSRTAASSNATMLFIAVVALVMPAVHDLVVYGSLTATGPDIRHLSLWASGVLIVIYLLSLLFSLKTHKALFGGNPEPGETEASLRTAAIQLVGATALIAYLSELLVGQIDAASKSLGMTELFIGVIVVAIVGNAAEHATAILVARRNHMDLAMTIAVGSSAQIALFVAPLLVFFSAAMGQPMSLVFNAFEIVAIGISVLIVEMISSDGETNWFEGVQLLAVYVLLAIAFYFVPARP